MHNPSSKKPIKRLQHTTNYHIIAQLTTHKKKSWQTIKNHNITHIYILNLKISTKAIPSRSVCNLGNVPHQSPIDVHWPVSLPFLFEPTRDHYDVRQWCGAAPIFAIAMPPRVAMVLLDVSSIGACRPRIFFINWFFCFLEDKWQRNGEGRERGDATSRRRWV